MKASMTNRERYLATMRLEEVDRVIRHEAIGIDEDTYKAWESMGWKREHGGDFLGEFGMDHLAPACFGAHLHPGFGSICSDSTCQRFYF